MSTKPAAESMIVAAARTPIGGLGGSLAGQSAAKLGATAIAAALARGGLKGSHIDEVIMGQVVQAGAGQNPARQASMHAGIPAAVGATTVNKVCGSGLKAVMLADQAIRAGDSSLVVAGGMESMSQAPYLLPGARAGLRLGHAQVMDAVVHDGLEDAYEREHMGKYGEACAAKYNFTRDMQDDFAVRSYQRALAAAEAGHFEREIAPVEITSRKGTTTISVDEEPPRFDEQKLRKLRAAFSSDGTVTAGNASSINDGAAAVIVASRQACEERELTPSARILGSATYSQEPQWFSTAPVGAVRKLLERLGWQASDVDLFEINEAFANVAMAAEHELDIPGEKINVFGGAVALGHPIGASGARILVTLLNALESLDKRRGIASLCLGGGEAVALAVERP